KSAELVFTNLPGTLEDQSVRIKAENLTIGEIEIRRGYTKEPHPRVKDFQAKIKDLESEDRGLTDEYAVLKESEKFLGSIATGSGQTIIKEINTAKISPQSWRQGLNFIVGEWVKVKTRMAEIERRQIDLKERLEALKRELNDIRADVEQRKTIIFDVSVKTPGNYKIELNYILPGAQWRTYYEIRGRPSEKKIELFYYGKIGQRTGEDWEDVRVVLSTGAPVTGGTAPIPAPWYIDLYTPYRGGQLEEKAAAKAGIPQLLPLTPSEVSEAPPPAPPVEAGIAIWYPLPGKYTIKSGDQEHKMLIAQTSFDADFEYFAMPRIAQLAYLTGRAKNTSGYLFIAGEASTYVGDDYTGKIYLPNIAPDESTKVSVGMDDRVKVTRETKKMKIKKGGLFGGKTRYEFTYENIIENFHTRDITCQIVDQTPIPNNPDINVGDIKIEPRPTEEDKDRSLYYWQVPIQAKGRYRITVSFTVEAPGDREIRGLLP
ncbi:MAG: mucoidy inhibitor MuiA family protein, partial [candidate division WOR-3 bacterium]